MNLKQLMAMVGDGKKSDRSANDFYETPPAATHALLDNETISEGGVWECACGAGAIAKVLAERGYGDVSASDLIDRGYGEGGMDFLSGALLGGISLADQLRLQRRHIITNPPFNLWAEFTERALSLVSDGKVIMFGKLTILAGQRRYEKIFSQNRLRRVYVFCRRVQITRPGETPGASMMDFAWFVFDNNTNGAEPVIKWIR